MTVTETPEYKRLALESSNEMIEHDASRGLGRYPEAALHSKQAGLDRLRMGQIMFDAGQFGYAVEDWLSAATCFLLGGAEKEAETSLDLVAHLEQQGNIGQDRKDLRVALSERKKQLTELGQRRQRLLQQYGLTAGSSLAPSRAVLDFLLGQVKELPGYPLLHYALYRQADQLGDHRLAAEHLYWAWAFQPDNANYTALLGYQFIGLGKPGKAIEIGRGYLAAHPTAPPHVRLMLANALASDTGGHSPDQAEAIAVLRPLLEDPQTGVSFRLAAIGLGATFYYELGNGSEARRLVESFDRLAAHIQSPQGQTSVSELRAVLPQPSPNGAAADSPRLLPRDHRTRVFRIAERLTLESLPVAA